MNAAAQKQAFEYREKDGRRPSFYVVIPPETRGILSVNWGKMTVNVAKNGENGKCAPGQMFRSGGWNSGCSETVLPAMLQFLYKAA